MLLMKMRDKIAFLVFVSVGGSKMSIFFLLTQTCPENRLLVAPWVEGGGDECEETLAKKVA